MKSKIIVLVLASFMLIGCAALKPAVKQDAGSSQVYSESYVKQTLVIKEQAKTIQTLQATVEKTKADLAKAQKAESKNGFLAFILFAGIVGYVVYVNRKYIPGVIAYVKTNAPKVVAGFAAVYKAVVVFVKAVITKVKGLFAKKTTTPTETK